MKRLTFATLILALLLAPGFSSAQGVLDRIFNNDDDDGVFNDLRETRENREQRVIETRENLQKRNEERAQEQREEVADFITRGLNTANNALSDHYLIFLNRLDGVLDKIEGNAESNEVELDEDVIEELRSDLNQLIREALDQKEKDYKVEVESLDQVRGVFQETKEEFLNDHKELRTEIRGLTEEVRELFSELKSQVPEPEEDEGEESDDE